MMTIIIIVTISFFSLSWLWQQWYCDAYEMTMTVMVAVILTNLTTRAHRSIMAMLTAQTDNVVYKYSTCRFACYHNHWRLISVCDPCLHISPQISPHIPVRPFWSVLFQSHVDMKIPNTKLSHFPCSKPWKDTTLEVPHLVEVMWWTLVTLVTEKLNVDRPWLYNVELTNYVASQHCKIENVSLHHQSKLLRICPWLVGVI